MQDKIGASKTHTTSKVVQQDLFGNRGKEREVLENVKKCWFNQMGDDNLQVHAFCDTLQVVNKLHSSFQNT